MELLSRNPNAYIRPSPSSGTLGGVAQTTFESCLLCEAAGYDVILVETVGVGQSEFKVADMVDLFCLIIPPAGGDELQGIKRGIIEVVDLVLVNKSDGDLVPAARRIQMEYLSALKYMPSNYPNGVWKPIVGRVSSREGNGMAETWGLINNFFDRLNDHKLIDEKRRKQRINWMWHHVQERLLASTRSKDFVKNLESKVENDLITPSRAANSILDKL